MATRGGRKVAEKARYVILPLLLRIRPRPGIAPGACCAELPRPASACTEQSAQFRAAMRMARACDPREIAEAQASPQADNDKHILDKVLLQKVVTEIFALFFLPIILAGCRLYSPSVVIWEPINSVNTVGGPSAVMKP